MSLQKDGGVIKKLLVAGDGWELPQKDDKVFGTLSQRPRRISDLILHYKLSLAI